MITFATRKPARLNPPSIEPLEQRIAPATFIVTTTADSGAGSLRQAIQSANTTPGADLINFNLGTGPFRIMPLTPLPDITEAVTIDGYSQPGTSVNSLTDGSNANLLVELSGASLANGNGLILGGSGGSIVRGLAIFGFGSGINETGNGIILKSSNNRVEGNFVGTDASGIGAAVNENKNAGIRVGDFVGSTPIYTGNVIGGTAPADRNVLTGNAFGVQLDEQSSGTQILGNLIGLNKSGATAFGNFQSGIADSGSVNTQIGNGSPAGRNVISGNANAGILQGSGTGIQIRGNYVGTNATASAAVGNGNAGLEFIYSASNGLIEGNVISGNGAGGIHLGSSVGDGDARNFNVRGNFIGTNSSGTLAVANAGAGIVFYGFAGGHTIGGTSAGQGNTIAFNGGAGIEAFGGGDGNRFLGNSIAKNLGLGINHGGAVSNFFGVTLNDSPDGDGVTNWPQLQTAANSGSSITLNGVLNAQSNRGYRVEFFALAPDQVDRSGYGEGATFLGFQDVTTNAGGAATITYTQAISLPGNTVFSATATPLMGGSTSEFGPVAGASTSYTWIGTAATSWFDPSNWTPNGVPGVLDTANIGSGSVVLTSAVSVKTLNLTGGSVGGTGELNVLGSFTWSGGVHANGTLRMIDGANGTIGGSSSPVLWSNGTLENHGAITVQAQGLSFNEGVLTNASQNSLVTLRAPVSDGDGAATAVSLSNLGTILKQTTGAFGLAGIPVSNAGTIRSEAGTFVAGSIQQVGGLTELAGGNITSAGTVQILGGDVVGSGTITGNLQNDSRVFIGGKDAPGILNIAGNYTQFANGTLVADIGGLAPGTGHDRLNVTGSATLAGTLQTSLLGTFVVRAGDSFSVLSGSPVTGVFSNVAGAPPIPVNYSAAQVTLAATGFVVSNTNDSGAGSLRQAILDANAQPGLDYISFNIPGGGLKTISPNTVLPAISGDTVIDAYSQPGASVNTLAVGSNAVLLVELSGVNVPNGPGSENGFSISSNKVTISGFIINRWLGYGVAVGTAAGGSSIVGNWIGTDSTGSAAPVNNQFGILLDDVGGVRIGSAAPRDRNVISGNSGNGIEINGSNATGNTIQGNYIGTTRTGAALLGNGFDGVYTQGPNTIIGGDKAGEGNVISGSLNSVGILINLSSAGGSSVRGNLIGTDVSGTLDFGNAGSGVEVVGSPNVMIGGSQPGAANVIAGNGSSGVLVAGTGSSSAVIEGNFIGTDKTRSLSLPNDSGIVIYQASGVTVGGVQLGAGNVIANNTGRGVEVDAAGGTAAGNTIRGNAIFGNGALGIDLVAAGDPPNGVTLNDPLDADSGANGLVNFPILSTFAAGANPVVTGTYSGLASSGFTIDVYASDSADSSGYGEGRYFLGTINVTTNASGTASFTVPLSGFIPPGGVLSAVATHSISGSTSEFSPVLATTVITTRTWDGGGGADTNWFNALNWTGDVVPGPADSAELLSNFIVTLNAPVTIANFTQADGTVTGGGSVTITSGFIWSKGTMTGPSTLTIAPGATAILNGADAKLLDRRFLDNQGTVLFSGTGSLQFKNGPLFTNSGVVEFQSDSNYEALDAIGATFTNSGSVRKTGGIGGSTIGLGTTTLTVNNTGTFDASGGTLGVVGGGTFSNATLNVAPGAFLRFGGGTSVFNGTTVIGGGGTVVLSAHNINAAGTVTQNGVTVISMNNGAAITSSGTWQLAGDGGLVSGGGAPGSFTISSGGVFRKSGGNGVSIIGVRLNNLDAADSTADVVVSSGSLRLMGGGTWDGTDPVVSSGAALELGGGTLSVLNRLIYVYGAGFVRITGGTLALVASFYADNAVSFELSGGLVNALSSEELVTYGPAVWSGGDINSADTGAGFESYGPLNITGAANRSLRGTLYAYGTTTINMTGTTQLVDDSAIYNYTSMTISGDGDFAHSGAQTGFFASIGNGTTNGILRKLDAGTTSFSAGIEFSASGRLELNAGTIATTDLAYLLGTTLLQGGTFAAAGGIELSANATPGREGILTGNGSITGDLTNFSGTIRPGGAGIAGTITVAGNFVQSAGGKFDVDIGGSGAGQFDVLNVTGSANLGGQLNVAFFNGYVPASGDVFTVVPSSSRTGTFSSVVGTGLLTAGYTPTEARLLRTGGTFVWDNSAGDGDWFNPLNWNLDSGVPGPADTAILDSPSTITLGSPANVGTFRQSSGTLTGSVDLTVQSVFEWTRGIQAGSGLTIVNGTAVMSGSLGKTIDTRIMSLRGGLIDGSTGNVTFANGGVFEVHTGGASLEGGHYFTGTGTLRIRAGNTVTTAVSSDVVVLGSGVRLENSGVLVAASGSFVLQGGAAAGGVFRTESSQTFTFSTGAFSFSSAVTFENDGTGGAFVLQSGSMNLVSGSVLAGPSTFRVDGGSVNTSSLTVAQGQTLDVNGGSIGGSGPLTVQGTLEWSGGTISVLSGSLVDSTGTLTLTPGGGATPMLTSNFTVNGGAVVTGPLTVINGATFTNNGTLEVQGSVTWSRTGGPALVNTGTFVKTAGGVFTLGGAFGLENSGTVNVSSGAITVAAGFVQTSGSVVFTGGSLINATSTLSGGTVSGDGGFGGSVLNSGAIIQPGGAGLIGLITISSTYTQTSPGVLQIDLAGTTAGAFDVLRVGGAVTFAGTLDLVRISAFTPSVGTVLRVVESANTPALATSFTGATAGLSQQAVSGGLEIARNSTLLTWDGGAVLDDDWFSPLNWDLDFVPDPLDTVRLDTARSITLSAPATTAFFTQTAGSLNGAALTATGGIAWTGGTIAAPLSTSSSAFNGIGGTGMVLLDGAAMTLDGTTQISNSIVLANGAELRNAGLFEFAGGAGISGSGAFENLGGSTGVAKTGSAQSDIAVEFRNRAALAIYGGTLRLSGGGVWDSNLSVSIAFGSLFEFAGGTQTFAGGNSFTGDGIALFSAGTLSTGAPGNGSLLVSSGVTFRQTGGAITGGLMEIQGAFDWSGGFQVGPGATILSGVATLSGSADLVLDARPINVEPGVSVIVSNTGTMHLNNSAWILLEGAMQISSAFTLTDDGNGSSSFLITSDGSLVKIGAGAASIRTAFVNDGALGVAGGELGFTSTFNQTSGYTRLSGGSLAFAIPAQFDGGLLRGTGIITGSIVNNGATIRPGNSPGQIIINGDFTQTNSGVLEIEIAGTVAGSGFDQLLVSGNAALGGTVDVSFLSFALGEGVAVEPISAASRSGTFGAVDVPEFTNVQYSADAFIIQGALLAPGLVRLDNTPGISALLIPGLFQGQSQSLGVTGLGDINGDSIADFAISAPGVAPSGETYVIFGRSGGLGVTLDVSLLDGTNGFKLLGGVNSRFSGSAVSSAGDLNGDGINDILIADSGSDLGDAAAGAAYVVFGKSGAYGATVDLSTLAVADGFVITGIAPGDAAGFSVRSAGDVNGDTINDIIIGVPQADANGADSGSAYIVFGSRNGFQPVFSLNSIDGTSGFRFDGTAAGDRCGESVAGAGDVNGDGFADIVIGAPGFDGAAGEGSGAAYLLFGKAAAFPPVIAASSLDGRSGFVIEGRDDGDEFGASVSAAGDFNGDGFADIISGARRRHSPEGDFSASAAYVVFGKARGFKAKFDLLTMTGANGFRLLTGETVSLGGIAVAAAGDFNNDGLDDILIGSPTENGRDGAAYLMFGRRSGFAPELELATLNDTTGFRFIGSIPGEKTGLAVAGAGDVDGDGFDDVLIAAPGSGSVYLARGSATNALPEVARNGASAQFTDVDGDRITVTVTGGRITADMFVFGADGVLQLVDLNAANTLRDGASITFAVRQNGGNGSLNVGAIDATGIRLGVVRVTGDLGQIDVGRGDALKPALKHLIVGSLGALGDSTQIPGTALPLFSEIRGALPRLSVRGDFTNATFDVLGRIGNATINGEFSGSGAFTAAQFAGLAALGRDVTSQVAGGNTLASSGLSAGSIGTLSIKQSLTNSAVTSGGGINSTTVGGSISKGAIVAAGAMRVVKVFGAITSDDPAVPSVVAALASPPSSKPAAAIAINTLLVRGDVLNGEILLGYNKAFEPVNGDASAGKVTIKGSFTASSLVAGVKDETADGFGLGDVRIGTPLDDPTPKIISRIASLIIGGVAEGSDTAGDSFGIMAQQINSAKIGGVKVVLDKVLKDDILLGTKGDLRLVEVL